MKRIDSAPEVNGARPCIVSFAAWKDKENVLRQAKLLKGCGIYITEDVSHKNGQSEGRPCLVSGGYRPTKSGSCRACSLVPGSCVGQLEGRSQEDCLALPVSSGLCGLVWSDSESQSQQLY